MPEFKTGKRGDLFIRFNIDLPDSVSKENIEQLKVIFPSLTTVEKDKDDDENTILKNFSFSI